MSEISNDFTLIDVFRSLQMEPLKESTWPAGAACRELYRSTYGCLPDKELRKKTNAEGSHCFAIYPQEFFNAATGIVQQYARERERQMRLI
jgi:hypothetical protein